MKISQAVIDLSANLRNGIKIEVAKDGTATATVTEGLYKANLPEDLVEAADKLHEHNSNFLTAAAKAVGEAAVDAMSKNKSCEHVEAVVPLLGKDTFTVGLDRVKSYPVPGGKEGEKVTQYGVINTKLDTVSARPNVGMMKLVRKEINEAALKAFGS